ncbi:MAG TPA: hypothetical protein VFP50_19765 [Anaeromyxobacteraceae bacterium]|nr:hypothetical protein [Anaeromyxobacteraceae bacterium]
MFDWHELQLKNGGRRDFWISQVALVERFLQTHAKELTKVQVTAQPHVAAAEVGMPGVPAQATMRTLTWDPTRGGMRMPHLHYAGEIYIMNEAQWAELGKSAVTALAEKMTKAQHVGFESVMQLSDVVAGL